MMIKVVFGKSSSQNYKTAQRKAKKTSYSFIQEDGKQNPSNIAIFEQQDLHKALSLWGTICGWKSSEFMLNDEIQDTDDIGALRNLNECYQRRPLGAAGEDYCVNKQSKTEMYFECKHLRSVFKNLPEIDLDYYRFLPYSFEERNVWYRTGRLASDNSKFNVDKERIKNFLFSEVELKKLVYCPFFKVKLLENQLDQLPDVIDFKQTKEFILDIEEDDPVVRTRSDFNKIKKKRKQEKQQQEEAQRLLEERKREELEGPYFVPNTEMNITYDDLGGLENEIQLIRECIEFPVLYPEVFSHLGITPFKGVLLHGPPGTGKTLLAKAVASQAKMSFYAVSGPEFFDKYVGESERKLRDIFQVATKAQPSIIFFDEIDAIASRRADSGSERIYNKIVAQFLALLDGMDSANKVFIIAATNRPDDLDSALRRPGRLDYEVFIGPPNERGRLEILKIHTKKMPLENDVDLSQLASTLHGYVGADLMLLCKEAGLTAFRKKLHLENKEHHLQFTVKMSDFVLAKAKVQPSAGREVISLEPKIRWEDVIGLDEIKLEIEKKIISPWIYRKQYPNIRRIKGLLLSGPPGVGKTYLSKALSNRMKMNIIALKGSDVLTGYAGEASVKISAYFKKARELAPCILVIDEIDAIAPIRQSNTASADLVNELLAQMDGFDELTDVIVIGTTNRVDMIDPAIQRPGRFDLRIELNYPSKQEIRQMVLYYLERSGFPFDASIPDAISGLQTGAEVENEINQAIFEAIWRKDEVLSKIHFSNNLNILQS